MTATRLFYDSEFTGLTQSTTLISLALVSPVKRSFYAEFSDFYHHLVNEFVETSVLAHTQWLGRYAPSYADIHLLDPQCHTQGLATECVGPASYIRDELQKWLAPLGMVEIWADHVSYDWVLFCELFGGALSLPDAIHYIPRDLCTYLECHGYDPDLNRVEFGLDYMDSSGAAINARHNALYDALVSMACYQRVEQTANTQAKK